MLLGTETTPFRWFHTCRVTQTSRAAQVATTVLATLLRTIGKASQDSVIVHRKATTACISVTAMMSTARTADVRTGSGSRPPARGFLDPQRPVVRPFFVVLVSVRGGAPPVDPAADPAHGGVPEVCRTEPARRGPSVRQAVPSRRNVAIRCQGGQFCRLACRDACRGCPAPLRRAHQLVTPHRPAVLFARVSRDPRPPVAARLTLFYAA